MIQETEQDIAARLKSVLAVTPPYSTINLSPSAVAMFSKMLDVQATEIFTLEQLMNIFETEIETIAAASTASTIPWIQAKVLDFEYNASTSPALMLNADLAISYPNPNPANRIVTAVSVLGNAGGSIIIRVAQGAPLIPLTPSQVTALFSYLEIILGAGENFNVISNSPDLLQLFATIYYNGQYNSTIQASVESSVLNYLSLLPFNGVVRLSDIENVIRAVPGVNDVDFGGTGFNNVAIIPALDNIGTYGTPVYLVQNGVLQSREEPTNSGYLQIDGANPLSNSLSYSVDNS